MIEVELNAQECGICRQVVSCGIVLFSRAGAFKNRDKWEQLSGLLEKEGLIGFETEQLRLMISAFNIHYLLMAEETDKLSKYLRGAVHPRSGFQVAANSATTRQGCEAGVPFPRSSLHESENPAEFFEGVRETLGEAREAPETYKLLQKRLNDALKDFTAARRFLPRKLYISDLHFYHSNLNHQMDMRGFEDETQMNAYMIRQWQEHVHEKDEVYVLGDFCFGRGEVTNEILRQLPGKKYLIIGNHDHYLEDKAFEASLFQWIQPYAEVKDRHRSVILSHYPVFCYNGQYRVNRDKTPKAYMLYGHVHNTLDEVLVNAFIRQTRAAKRMSKYDTEPRPIPCNMINCFCMFSDYIPLTLDEWIAVDEKRRKELSDVSDNPV